MPATLLYIGEEETLRADLAFVPPSSPVVRADTIAAARRYLLRDPDATGPHLIAYSADIAAQFEVKAPEAAIGFAFGPAIVLYHQVAGTPAFTAAAVRRLRAVRAVVLPLEWEWLLRELANPQPSPIQL